MSATFEQRLALHNAQVELEALKAEGRGMLWANEVCVQEQRPIVHNDDAFTALAARIRQAKVQIDDAVTLERLRG